MTYGASHHNGYTHEAPLHLPYPQNSNLPSYLQPHVGELSRTNFSQFGEHRYISSTGPEGLHNLPSVPPIDALPPNVLPPPPYPPSDFQSSIELASFLRLRPDAGQIIEGKGPNAPSQPQPADQTTGDANDNDLRKSDVSSTSEMDLEDGEVSDEGSTRGHQTFDDALHSENPYYISEQGTFQIPPSTRNGELQLLPSTSDHLADLKKKVSDALVDLYAQGIGFDSLAQEGIDKEILKDLYRVLDITATNGSDTRRDAGNKRNKRQPSPDRLGDEAQFRRPSEKQKVSQSNGDLQPKLSTQSRYMQDRGEPKSGPEPVSDASPRTVVADVQCSHQALGASAGEAQGSDQIYETSGTAVEPLRKPSISTTKPLDRKDYIARMLEAKKKSLPRSTPNKSPGLYVKEATLPAPNPKESSVTPTHVMGQGAGILNAVSPNPGAIMATSSERSSKPTNDDNKISRDVRSQSELEAKKKAQTELARQKMEALLKRSQVKATNHSQTTQTNDQAQPVSRNVKEASHEGPISNLSQQTSSTLPASSMSPTAQNSFSIPGLFTSSGNSANIANSSTNLTFQSPQNVVQPFSALNDLPQASSPGHQPVSSMSSDAVPAFAKSLGPNEQGSTNLMASKSCKRQKAADFIDSPPGKSSRRLGSGDDMSVIIEVSDDELYGEDPEDDTASPSKEAVAQSSYDNERPRAESGHALSSPAKLSALATAPPITRSRGLMTVRGAKGDDTQGLKSKERAIEEMQQRIAELEERRKAKSSINHAQTSGGILKEPYSPIPHKISSPRSRMQSPMFDSRTSRAHLRPENTETFSEAEKSTQDEPSLVDGIVPDQEMNGSSSPVKMPSSSRFEEQAQRPQIMTVASSKAADAEPKRSSYPTTPSSDRFLELHNVRTDPTLKPDITISVNSTSSPKNETATASGDSEMRVNLLRLEELRAQVALLEKQMQIRPLSSGARLQKPSSPPSSTDILPSMNNSFSLPEISAATDVKTVVEVAPQFSSLMQPPENDGSMISAPETNNAIQYKSLIRESRNDEQGGNEYDPAEDAMDLDDVDSDSGAEQGEIKENDHTASSAASFKEALRARQPSEDAYEPPADFDHFGSPFDQTSTTTEGRSLVSSANSMELAAARTSNAVPGSHVGEDEQRVPTGGEAMSRSTNAHASFSGSFGGISSIEEAFSAREYEPSVPRSPVDLPQSAVSSSSFAGDRVDTVPKPVLPQDEQLPPVEERDKKEPSSSEPLELVSQVATNPTIPSSKRFTPYDSPLKAFKDYRNSLNDSTALCPYETLGICNDPICKFQHLAKAKLSDDKIIVQLGSAPTSLTPEQQERFKAGLRNLIGQMRTRNVRDFSQLVAEVVAYRQDFLGDKYKVLAL